MEKYAVWACVWDNRKKTFVPSFKMSSEYDTRQEAQDFLDANFTDNETTKYSVFKTNGNTGYY